jgi:hypothetical protein
MRDMRRRALRAITPAQAGSPLAAGGEPEATADLHAIEGALDFSGPTRRTHTPTECERFRRNALLVARLIDTRAYAAAPTGPDLPAYLASAPWGRISKAHAYRLRSCAPVLAVGLSLFSLSLRFYLLRGMRLGCGRRGWWLI